MIFILEKIKKIALFSYCITCCVYCKINEQKDDVIDNPINKLIDDSVNLNAKKIENLVLLGKVWGFLKYYHPVVASGKYNWDSELFKILPKIIHAENRIDRNNILSFWIDSLGKFDLENKLHVDSVNVKMYADINWIDDSTLLGNKLSKRLNNVKNAKRLNQSFYVSFPNFRANPEFTHEETIENLRYPAQNYQLISIYRYWNIIQYFYPYKNLLGNWDSVLPKYIPKFIKARSNLDYKKLVLELITNLNDSHVGIYNVDSVISVYKGINIAPFKLSFVENKVVVVGHLKHQLATSFLTPKSIEKPSLEIGDIILSINNRSIDNLIKERNFVTPASNINTKLRNIAMEL